MSIPAIILLAYIGVLLILGMLDRKKQATTQFMIADRRVGWFGTMASLAGNLRDGAGLAAWVVLGSYYGFGSLWLTAGLGAALALLALLAPGIRRLAHEHDYISAAQLIETRIGRQSARITALVIATTAFLYSAAQVYVSGRIFSSLWGWPETVGMAGSAVIVGAYLSLGGYRTTIRTGVVQWAIIMVIVLVPWLIAGGSAVRVHVGSTSPSVEMAAVFFGISFLVVLSSADVWQLIFSARSPAQARLGFAATIPIYFVISAGMVLFAAAIVGAVGAQVNANDAFFVLFKSTLLPSWLIGIIGVFAAAAIMSTLDSQVFLFSSTVIREVLPASVHVNDARMERATRFCIVIAMSLLAVLAVTIGNIVQFLFSAVTLGTTLAPVLVWAVLRRGRASAWHDICASIAILSAVVVYIVLFASGSFSNLAVTLIPAGVSTALCLFLAGLESFRGRRALLNGE